MLENGSGTSRSWTRSSTHRCSSGTGPLDEEAAAITFLACDEASYITGTVLLWLAVTPDDRRLAQSGSPFLAGTDGRQTVINRP
jgi:hypothetical protein